MSIEFYPQPKWVRQMQAEQQANPAKLSPKPALVIRIYYRICQFIHGLAAHVSADEMLVAAYILPKAALARFCQMPLDAQRHSLNVLYKLEKARWTDPDLAAAALLHDVGTAASAQAGICLNPWWRGPLVLLQALLPGLVQRVAAEDPRCGWRYLLYVHLAHPAIGADWAAEAECSELTCWLIEHHQDKLCTPPRSHREELLAMLQWADNRS